MRPSQCTIHHLQYDDVLLFQQFRNVIQLFTSFVRWQLQLLSGGAWSRARGLSECMTVLLKNLFTVHIFIWQTQIRNQHYLWWRNKARPDTARRSMSLLSAKALWRRAALEIHSIPMPGCALWTGPTTTTTPPTQTNKPTTQHPTSPQHSCAIG